MKTIWKFPLPLDRDIELQMPQGAEALSVGIDAQERRVLWARVETTAPKESRYFNRCGTGFELPPDAARFVGTWMEAGEFVWHLFEVTRSPA